MPTNTWYAYDVRDGNGDGVGDSWYADKTHLTIETGRPFLFRGVPFRFRFYDLPFLRWLDRTGKGVDVLSDLDLHRTTGEQLAQAYTLIVFPGHHEYVTRRSTTRSSATATWAAGWAGPGGSRRDGADHPLAVDDRQRLPVVVDLERLAVEQRVASRAASSPRPSAAGRGREAGRRGARDVRAAGARR